MTLSQLGSLAAAKSLYRSLLRAHARHLPAEMRQLGDAYVKAEFRLHSASHSKASTAMKPHQIQQFLTEWQQYLDQILLTAKAQESVSAGSPEYVEKSRSVFSFGKDLPPNVELTDEQKSQLEKLREEATKR